jgi:hypothetical protein
LTRARKPFELNLEPGVCEGRTRSSEDTQPYSFKAIFALSYSDVAGFRFLIVAQMIDVRLEAQAISARGGSAYR